MNRKLFFSGFFTCLILLSGCIGGGKSSETRLFSLPAGAVKEMLPCQVTILRFRNLSGADRRFLFRYPHNRMQTDEFSRWLLDPELMLERFLRTELRGRGSRDVRVRGVITAFEFDSRKKTAVLAVDFTLHCGDLQHSFTVRQEKSFAEPGGDVAESAAEAMEKCAGALEEELRKQVILLYKQAQAEGMPQ